jgi:tRNA/rRNA methyltransferase
MKNTGFQDMRLVGVRALIRQTYTVAVHAEDILERARMFEDIPQATEDCHLIFAATAKTRKNFALLTLEEAVAKMCQGLPKAQIGLLFGCERTGLTSSELRHANFVFTIPQASRQPSYNLSSAVLLVLFHIFARTKFPVDKKAAVERLTRKEQEECIQLILERLEEKQFIHRTNKRHMTERIYDLIGRLSLTSKDRSLLMALFAKGVEGSMDSCSGED